MELNKGNISTTIAALFLLGLITIIGAAANDQAILVMIIETAGLPLTILGLATAITIALYDYANPRIQDVVETGTRLQSTPAGVATIIFEIVIVIITVITTNPALLEPILQENYALFLAVIVPILSVLVKVFTKRQPAELPENIA